MSSFIIIAWKKKTQHTKTLSNTQVLHRVYFKLVILYFAEGET